jgi:hypothetical protein
MLYDKEAIVHKFMTMLANKEIIVATFMTMLHNSETNVHKSEKKLVFALKRASQFALKRRLTAGFHFSIRSVNNCQQKICIL